MLSQIIRFVLVGIIGALFDYGSRSLALHYGMPPAPARAVSYVIGSTVAYILNSAYTFNGDRSRSEQVRAAGVYGLCFAAAVLVDKVVRMAAPGYPHVLLISWFISQAAATSLNFVLQRTWVFRAEAGTASAR